MSYGNVVKTKSLPLRGSLPRLSLQLFLLRTSAKQASLITLGLSSVHKATGDHGFYNITIDQIYNFDINSSSGVMFSVRPTQTSGAKFRPAKGLVLWRIPSTAPSLRLVK